MKTIIALLAVPVFVLVSFGSVAQPKVPPPAGQQERRAPPQAPNQAATDTAQPDTTRKPLKMEKEKPLASQLKPTKKQICNDKCTKSSPPGFGAAAAYSICMANCMQQ